jgi:FKBP-type peptidyl-prolyl cis-trans isomerase FkpA
MMKPYRVALLLLALATIACGSSPSTPSAEVVNVPYSQTDLIVGSGRVVANGNRVTAHYTLWLYSSTAPENKGNLIQSSVGGSPFTFTLGAGQVIKGWDQGVPGMAVGGKRRLVVPPSLAYGSQGSPPAIPGNATLVFEIDVVSVTD